MKIFFYTLREFDELACAKECSAKTDIAFDYTTAYPSAENAAFAQGYEAISMTPCDMSAPMLERFASIGVKYLLCRSIGYDHVDLRRARELGMRVSNVSYPPSGVANYAIMLMLMLQRRAVSILDRARLQDYSLRGKIGADISFETVGVIGTGHIGTTVIQHLSGFGCKILCYDPTEQNYHLLNREAFARMKDGVLIVNTARGKLIDTDALVEALENGKIGGAALDVLEKEDGLYYYNRIGDVIANRDMALLRSFPNVILSPHTAFYTEQAVSHMVGSCFEAAQAFDKGEESGHEVKIRV